MRPVTLCVCQPDPMQPVPVMHRHEDASSTWGGEQDIESPGLRQVSCMTKQPTKAAGLAHDEKRGQAWSAGVSPAQRQI